MIRWFRAVHPIWMSGGILVVGALIASPSQAQVEVSPSVQAKNEPQPPKQVPKVIEISPMAQPDPLLRYRLWPAPERRQRENIAPLVSRAVLMAGTAPKSALQEFSDRNTEWSELSIDELPQDDVEELLAKYTSASAIRELQRGENLMQIDYNLQLDGLSANELIETLLPEYSEMRQLARILALRARLAVAQGRWDDAMKDLRVGIRLGEFAGRSTDFLVGRLIGFAIHSLMMGVIEEAIQRPDCPNLYWALAGMPVERLFETKQALEFESVLTSRIFDFAEPLPEQPIGAAAARERIKRLIDDANATLISAGGENGSTSKLMAGLYVVSLTEPSRELLSETAEWSGRVDELSSAEAVLRATMLKFARARDRWVAWSTLPNESWDEYTAEREMAFGESASDGDLLVSMVNMLMPAVQAARSAGLRTTQQHHLLATIEAIRMHAAKTGELPKSLDAMRPVPAWQDALAGAPFKYQRASKTEAILTRTPRFPNDQESIFQIKLRGNK